MTESPILDCATSFGGNGNVSLKEPFLDGYCLTDGPFGSLEMPYIGADYKPQCLSRGFPNYKKAARLSHGLRPEALEGILSLLDYESLNSGLENGPHLAVPKIVRGNFQFLTAPNGSRPLAFMSYILKG